MSNRLQGWSETPIDLLIQISNQIHTVSDFFSFRSVCKSWRSSVSAVNFLVSPPELLAPLNADTNTNKQEKDGEQYFLGFTKGGILNGNVFKCIGSKQNWIITADSKARIRILNPFSNVVFELPIQTAWNFKHHVSKVVLSSTPDKDNCVAVALCDDRLLCMARPGNRSWTILKQNIDDVVFLKGEFYAITWMGNVSVFDINGEPVREIPVPPLPYSFQLFEVDKKLKHYLVEHSEELLIVTRKKSQPDYSFELHRFDFEHARLQLVKRVRWHWLFLGFQTSVMMAASDPSMFLRDSVYFTQSEQKGGVCIKRFDMITKKVEDVPMDCVSFKTVRKFQFSHHESKTSVINDQGSSETSAQTS